MKKRLTALFVAISVMFGLTGCGGGSDSCEVALITDIGTVEDGGYNEECYKGIKRLCDEKGLTYKYYIPDGYDTVNYMAQINAAVEAGVIYVIHVLPVPHREGSDVTVVY